MSKTKCPLTSFSPCFFEKNSRGILTSSMRCKLSCRVSLTLETSHYALAAKVTSKRHAATFSAARKLRLSDTLNFKCS